MYGNSYTGLFATNIKDIKGRVKITHFLEKRAVKRTGANMTTIVTSLIGRL
jgi:hypothetical protein